MKLIFVILALVGFSCVYAGDASDYLKAYGKTGQSDYTREQVIVGSSILQDLVTELTPFYSDTLPTVRQKAYYLTYKKASLSNNLRYIATNILLKGCSDKDAGIISQNLGFLKGFHLDDFDSESAKLLQAKLSNHRVQHYKDFVLLAGFMGTGKDILYQKMLDQAIPARTKWHITLALARMGMPEQIAYCMNKAKSLPVSDNLLDYFIPDIIYMRQKEGIDFCVSILNNDGKLCHSLDPDNQEKIICGYRMVERLAAVIADIPLTLDATGSLITTGNEDMVAIARKWFHDNPLYRIRKDTF